MSDPAAPKSPLAARATMWLTSRLFRIVVGVAIFVTGLWAVCAIYWSNLPAEWLRTFAASAFGGGTVIAYIVSKNRWKTTLRYTIAFGVVAVWWMFIPASHDRDWAIDVSVLPEADVDGDRITIRGVRNFDHRTLDDFTPAWEERTVYLSKLNAIDLALSYWDGNRDIAHMVVSFGFSDGQWLAVSIETRREKTESYSPISSFFKQFELIYVFGDERDILRKRTNAGKEDVYLYPMTLAPELRSALFMGLIERANGIAKKAEWYNTIKHNCTTSWIEIADGVSRMPVIFDMRMLLNGYFDELCYERGTLVADETQGLPYEEMRAKHAITALAQQLGEDPDFSRKLRARMPKRK